MPENRETQSRPRDRGLDNPQGGPRIREEPKELGSWDRPSDTQAAHAPNEGQSVRDRGHRTDTVMREVGADGDPAEHSAMGGMGDGGDPASAEASDPNTPDLFDDYGQALQNVERGGGTDRHTAGAGFADRMPREAVATDANEIAADDAGASAFAERAAKGDTDEEA
ncbi:MAG TPA: hypothetical protein VD929_08970 [Caulobacteraceae bacterium]|nr:hypothetical protein [Caulobacteraceae bacterium]